MKRRGLLTKLALSIVAGPSVAKAVADAYELPIIEWEKPQGEGTFSPAWDEYGLQTWDSETEYALGSIVLDTNNQLYVSTTTTIQATTHPMDSTMWVRM